MKTPDIPNLPGIKKMSPLDMNAIHIEKRHTVLTPDILEKMRPKAASTAVQQG